MKGFPRVAVVIDNDKNSLDVLKWADKHIYLRDQIVYLLHVRRKIGTIPAHGGRHLSIHEFDDDLASPFLDQEDSQTNELILPLKAFSSRRGFQCKEVILDSTDVAKTIIDFIQEYSIHDLVIGASSRSRIDRLFNRPDVAMTVLMTAPDYCSIFVISEGELYSFRDVPFKKSVIRKTSHSFFVFI